MQWELAESFPKVSWACRELAGGDRELARKASGVCQKKTKRLIGRSWGLPKSLLGKISSGHQWTRGVDVGQVEVQTL
ncbi:hypothetical protein GW17_00038306 [Ensete ventricosum]|nr:hypothetical protein GW17_00038306 [Ensete ventricosum]RZS09307.1 hypothetical protein BHM03_00040379 [Ensete ventricosum]